MRTIKTAALLAPIALGLIAAAPQPTKPVPLQSYLGKWYEVARLHNQPEEPCVRAQADYIAQPDGGVRVVQTCFRASGPPKYFRANMKIVDPGTNAKFRLTFFPFVYKDYWVLDYGPDNGWVVLGEPTGKYLWLFSRTPNLQAHKAELVARAKALGYNTNALIYDKAG
jgi:apolipoprotein D and lipocalin family protein